MTNLKDIIVELEVVFRGIAGQYTKKEHEIDDAVQMLYEMFLTMNQKTLNRIFDKDGKDGIIKYAAVTIRRYFTSHKNRYYYTYKKYYDYTQNQDNINVEYIMDNYHQTETYTPTWVYLEKIDVELDNMYWYDRDIYKLYYSIENNETLDTLAKKTGISRNSLFNTIDNVRKILKTKLND